MQSLTHESGCWLLGCRGVLQACVLAFWFLNGGIICDPWEREALWGPWRFAKWSGNCFKDTIPVGSILMMLNDMVGVWSKTCSPQGKRCEPEKVLRAWFSSVVEIISLRPSQFFRQVNMMLLRLTLRYNLNCHNFWANDRCTVSDAATKRTRLCFSRKPGSCYLVGVLLRNQGSDFLNFLGVFLVL